MQAFCNHKLGWRLYSFLISVKSALRPITAQAFGKYENTQPALSEKDRAELGKLFSQRAALSIQELIKGQCLKF